VAENKQNRTKHDHFRHLAHNALQLRRCFFLICNKSCAKSQQLQNKTCFSKLQKLTIWTRTTANRQASGRLTFSVKTWCKKLQKGLRSADKCRSSCFCWKSVCKYQAMVLLRR